MDSTVRNAYFVWLAVSLLLAVLLTALMHGAEHFSVNFLFYLTPLVVCSSIGVNIGSRRSKNLLKSGAIGIAVGLVAIAILIGALIFMLSMWGV